MYKYKFVRKCYRDEEGNCVECGATETGEMNFVLNENNILVQVCDLCGEITQTEPKNKTSWKSQKLGKDGGYGR